MDADCGYEAESWSVPGGAPDMVEVISGAEMEARITESFERLERDEQSVDPDLVVGDVETIDDRWKNRGEPWTSEYLEQVEILRDIGRTPEEAAREAEAGVRRLMSIQAVGDLVGARRV